MQNVKKSDPSVHQEGREENLADSLDPGGGVSATDTGAKSSSRVARGWPAAGWGAPPKEAAATKRGRQPAMKRGGGEGDGGEEGEA